MLQNTLSRLVIALAALTMIAAKELPKAKEPSKANEPLKVKLPPVGMRILNTYYVTDSAGHIMPDSIVKSPMEDDAQFVIASGVKFRGKTCVAFWGPQHPDTTYMSYTKNGDVWIIHPREKDPGRWESLPFSLKRGKVIKTKPVREVYGADFVMYHRSETQVLGHDTVSIAGKGLFDCIKLQVLEIRRSEGVDYANAFCYWFSPELGYVLRASYGWNGPYFMYQQVKDFIIPKS